MRVKICGIRTFEEAMLAIEAGADLLGFNFYSQSPRYIVPGECMRLVVRLEEALRGEIARVMLVGVFVNAEAANIHAIFRDCHLDMIQLSGDEPPELVEQLGERTYKAHRITTQADLDAAVSRYPRRQLNPAYLIDAYRPGAYGGTGQTVDWSVACQAAQRDAVLLAGGLKPENVADAICQVHPWGVDVASGVEARPGVKDPQKVRDFIQAARSFSEEHGK